MIEHYGPLAVFPLLFLFIAILVIGKVIGNRAERQLRRIFGAGTVAVALISALHFGPTLVHLFAQPSLAGQSALFEHVLYGLMFGVLGPMYFALGLSLGGSNRNRHDTFAGMFSIWQKQLDFDLASGANPLILVHDLKTIGEICYHQLNQYDEAAKAFDRAYEYVKETCPRHAYAADFYSAYIQVLNRVGRKADAQRVQNELDALPKPLLEMRPSLSR
jgi:tetratricopeptide (TPR) repeat protein